MGSPGPASAEPVSSRESAGAQKPAANSEPAKSKPAEIPEAAETEPAENAGPAPAPDLHPAARIVLSTPALRTLARHLPSPRNTRTVGGAPGSLPLAAMAALATRLPHRRWIVAASTPGEAGEYLSDLETLLGPGTATHYPQREGFAPDGDESRLEVQGRRVEAFESFLLGPARILVATRRALQEVAPLPRDLGALRFTVKTGQSLRPAALVDALEERGLERVPTVEQAGQYAVRGGLIDLFSFGAASPARVEFLGDEVESIRFFDILDQRSTHDTARVDILPVSFGAGRGAERPRAPGTPRNPQLAPTTASPPPSTPATAPPPASCSFLDRLARDTVLVRIGNDGWAEEAAGVWRKAEARFREAVRRGSPAARPAELFLPPEALAERARRHPQLLFAEEHVGDPIFQAQHPPPIERDTRRLRSFLAGAAAAGAETHILCDNDGQAARLEELLAVRGTVPAGCHLVVGSISGGFRLADSTPPVNVLTDHEIFRRSRKLRRRKRFRGAASLESLAQLSPGDYVVHMEHGIGRYRGLERVTVGGESIESLVIAYDGDEILRLPVNLLDRVERWVGTHPDDAPARLHRIGGKRWQKLRRRTEAAINRMTAELLDLYAARRARPGHSFPPDTRWQREMESSFLYEDTPDQRRAVEDVKRDMESAGIMDRLVCGDAGYGKTEVAVRAAFKAVQDGKQVAVLAPTTVLVVQHARTFGDRLADYPVRVESLSRLDPPACQRQVLAAVADGQADIVIGTHRLLSGDVAFRDLGLVVIDEEQRLGVRQKERLKRLRTTVDVLTLTATPIPRTLYLSLAGIRDLSLIRTPPRDRMPVVTHVIGWSDHLVSEACQKELDRGGQVFFLHNRVETIDTAAARVRALLPGASVGVAHGQMPPRSLDREMTRFVDGATDILVCSSIIENGLDVPNANTLIVTRADRFGLSQLYQIRGRVGRWDRRAYCYLIAPEKVTPEAERRLRVLEHYTELGSGYQIALRDLEVRGAGSLLGEDQSGFAHAVGLDTYMRLMEEAVKRLQGDPAKEQYPRPEVTMEAGAYLPDEYVADPHQKLHLYRRLSRITESGEVGALAEELTDRFGTLPPAATRLLHKTKLAIAGRRAGVDGILVRGRRARVNFLPGVTVRMSGLEEALRGEPVAVEVRRIAPLSLVLECTQRGRLVSLVVRAVDALSARVVES